MAGLLYESEEQRDRTIAQYMQDRVQEALDAYKPMRAECDLAMSGHRSYPRSIITKDGELRLSIPKFRCSDGDLEIASAIEMTYGNEANHQLCQFHLPGRDAHFLKLELGYGNAARDNRPPKRKRYLKVISLTP